MSFWSSDFTDEDSPVADPKRKFRFRVSIVGLGTLADSATDTSTIWMAKTATKPSFQISAAEHKYLNHTFYYPGTVTWQDVTITLVDPQDPDIAASFGALMDDMGYGVPDNDGSFATMTKASAASALSAVEITQLNGAGAAIETWTLHNAFITEFKFGDLEYGSDDLTELSLTMKYDWATMSDGTTEYFAAKDTASTTTDAASTETE